MDTFVVEEMVCELNGARCTFSLLKNEKVIGMFNHDDEEFYVAIDSWQKARELFQRHMELGWKKI